MYSVVLAAMLTAGPATTPAWGHGCCCGGYSCCCGGYNAFSYSCCCGGWHSSCCCGGWYSSCCCGGYYSSCCCGGWAGYGSWYPSYWSCSGSCYGCCCGGGWYSAGYGWDGGGWYRGSYGWQPVYACCGGFAAATTPTAPASPAMPRATGDSVTSPAPATVLIKAPLDVHVTVNAQAIDRQSAEQTFTTSDLQPGNTYSYDIRAEAVRDGKTVTRAQKVIVRAGQESRADFTDLTADGPAHVAITAPADARVTVDGVEVPASGRTFNTPGLEAGRTYYYMITAEMTRDGRKVNDSRHVLVSAGQDVSVRFEEPAVTTAGR